MNYFKICFVQSCARTFVSKFRKMLVILGFRKEKKKIESIIFHFRGITEICLFPYTIWIIINDCLLSFFAGQIRLFVPDGARKFENPRAQYVGEIRGRRLFSKNAAEKITANGIIVSSDCASSSSQMMFAFCETTVTSRYCVHACVCVYIFVIITNRDR